MVLKSLENNISYYQFWTLGVHLKKCKGVSFYQVLSSYNGIYQVQVVFDDGEEIIDEGDLLYFNTQYLIIENKTYV